ncbi:MAG: glycosyltransferase family 2 protein [Candidatus Nezhaarchaeales archaeon]
MENECPITMQKHQENVIDRITNNQRLRISIVIPTLNEAEGIRETISRIPMEKLKNAGFEVEIIVVDGGSRDGTDRIAKELGARVIYEPRRGYGRAYKTGFSAATGNIIVTLDGDASYPPEVIPQLVKLMLDNNLDFITTQRIPEPGSMSLINRFGNYVLSLITRILFRINLKDSQSGMWVIRKDALKDIMPRSDGMEFSEEIKIKAYLCGKKVYEHPIQYRKRVGKPKLRRFRDGLRNLVYLFVIYVRSHMGRRCYE